MITACERCEGKGSIRVVKGAFPITCPKCKGTRTQEDTSSIQNPPDWLAENRKRIEKLEADLAAAKLIIVEAGKQVESLKASIKEAYEALAPVRSVMESNITASAILQKAIQSPAPVQDAPVSEDPYPQLPDGYTCADSAYHEDTPRTIYAPNGDVVTVAIGWYQCWRSAWNHYHKNEAQS